MSKDFRHRRDIDADDEEFYEVTRKKGAYRNQRREADPYDHLTADRPSGEVKITKGLDKRPRDR